MAHGVPVPPSTTAIPSDLHPPSYAEVDYIHREHMYEIWRVPHRKLKVGAACLGMLAVGGGLPFVTVWWQNTKAGRPAFGPNPDQVTIADVDPC